MMARRSVDQRDAPIRVLHVITGLAAGGAEDQLRLLLPRLRKHGVTTEVAVFYNAGSVAASLRADGIPVTDLRSPGFWDWRGTKQLTGLIRAGGYDAVHTHLFRAGLHGRIAARRAGVKALIHTEHSLNPVLIEGRRRSFAINWLYRWAERRGALTVAVSTAVAHELSDMGVPADRIRILPNGIELDQLAFDPLERKAFRAEHGLAETDFVVLCLGRLAASKRLERAIEAVARFTDEQFPDSLFPAPRLLVVGAGEERERLEALADAQLPGRVVFTGELPGDRLPAALSAADLLFSPAPEETFGLSVVSAAAAGLPVAFASCPALTELRLSESDLDGPTPIQPVSGTVDSFGEVLRRALAARTGNEPTVRRVDPGLAAALHAYDIESIAERMAQLYRELLGPSTDGPTAQDNQQFSQDRTVGVHHV